MKERILTTSNNFTTDIEDSLQVSSKRRISVCSCQQSKKYPICDGTHKIFNKETNSNLQPIIIETNLKENIFPEQNSSNSNSSNSSSSSSSSHSKKHHSKHHKHSDHHEKTKMEKEDSESLDDNQTNENEKKKLRYEYNFVETKNSEEDDKEKDLNQNDEKEEDISVSSTRQRKPKHSSCKPPSFKFIPPIPLPEEPPFPKVNRKEIDAVYSKEEVAKHNKENDLWMIINGSVYDLTPYVSYHPGSRNSLLKFAGTDGSINVQFHSSKMMKLLNTYFYIGKLEGHDSSSCVIS